MKKRHRTSTGSPKPSFSGSCLSAILGHSLELFSSQPRDPSPTKGGDGDFRILYHNSPSPLRHPRLPPKHKPPSNRLKVRGDKDAESIMSHSS